MTPKQKFSKKNFKLSIINQINQTEKKKFKTGSK